MLGNLMRESGVVSRLTKASENEIANVVTLFLGLCIGATMVGSAFIKAQTLIVLALGFVAICLDTVCGVLMGKAMRVVTGGKVNPLIGAAGISAFPMAARVVQREGRSGTRRATCSCTRWAPTPAARSVRSSQRRSCCRSWRVWESSARRSAGIHIVSLSSSNPEENKIQKGGQYLWQSTS